MARKKTDATEAAPSKAPAKRAAKKSDAKPGKSAKKAADKPAKSAPKRKNTKHADVPNETVLAALSSGKPMSKGEVVAACGGDAIAVTKTIQRLRGLGQVVVQGNSRAATYSKAA